MKILVTGGAGYVGSHAVKALVEAGHEVFVYDNLSRGHAAAVPPGQLIVGELADRHLLAAVMQTRKIEAVVHFAALAYVGESVEKPDLYYRNNVGGSLVLLAAMQAAGVSRIVFSSTTATYGVPQRIPTPEDEPQRPVNPYGFTKFVIERVLDDYAQAHGLAFAALRYFNAAGCSADGTLGEDHDPETHLIPITLQVALGQRPQIMIFGDDWPTPDGTCVRDYVHVDDLAAAHAAALNHLQPGRGLKLNLGTGRGHSVREVIEACRKVTGHAIPCQVGPRRPGDPPMLVADAGAAQRILGWSPRFTTIESIVETAWRWQKAHPRGYEKS